ncbi:hypothetical protein QOT17_009003 [Balamuthia mandrillaris]
MQPSLRLLFCFLLSAALCSAGPLSFQGQQQPLPLRSPPALAQAFTTNWTVAGSDNTQQAFLSGGLALDAKLGAMRFSVAGAHYFPVYFETTVIANPNVNPDDITFYWFERNNICWTEVFTDGYIDVLSWSLPDDAQYVRDETVDGVKCSVWTFELPDGFPGSLTVWVNKAQTQYGYLVKQALSDLPVFGAGLLQITFENTVAGPLDPSIYAPPSMPCTTPDWNVAMNKRTVGFGRFLQTIVKMLSNY